MFSHALDLVRGRYDKPKAKGEVSHFQALSTALSGTVGLGNIAGVAVAGSVGIARQYCQSRRFRSGCYSGTEATRCKCT